MSKTHEQCSVLFNDVSEVRGRTESGILSIWNCCFTYVISIFVEHLYRNYELHSIFTAVLGSLLCLCLLFCKNRTPMDQSDLLLAFVAFSSSCFENEYRIMVCCDRFAALQRI